MSSLTGDLAQWQGKLTLSVRRLAEKPGIADTEVGAL